MTLPKNDSSMEYNFDRHMYILTTGYVANELNIDLIKELKANGLARSKKPERFLLEVSADIYKCIYDHCRADMKDWVEYMLAKREDWRGVIKNALEYQVEYVLTNGRLANFSGKNLYKNTSLDLKGSYISEYAKNELANNGLLYGGFYQIPLNFKKRGDY